MEALSFTSQMEYGKINRNAQPYPAYLLPEGGTALALFAAGFHGWNDVIHMARKEMEITCVDVDYDKLWEMAEIYPNIMTFYVKDAWDFATEAAEQGREWDVVSVDPFMGGAAEKAWESIPLWMSLARETVTVTVAKDAEFVLSEGPVAERDRWTYSTFPRSSRASWLVLRRS